MSAHDEIEQHFATFQRLVTQADSYLRISNYRAAAVYAEIAASYATANHAGLFVSTQLEEVLLAIGRKIAINPFSVERNTLPRRAPRRVLHVLTEAAGIGGHSRMVWRWIQQDTESCHSVVLTRQGVVRIPQALEDATKASHGKVYLLNESIGSILTWAKLLRKIAAAADIVVLHIYTDDVIPLIAFADRRGIPPVIFLNHSDHKFWLGAGVSNSVVDQRHSGTRLSQTRRGIERHRSGLLPIALNSTPRKYSRSEAKERIGLSQDTILLLSIARPSKFLPLAGYESSVNDLVLPDSILPVLQKFPNTALIVIGPEHSDRWARASRAVQGRIKALGKREDTALFYQAADIYLDSFPFTSITSVLEAANYGLPSVSCHPYSDASDVLCADTPALTHTIIRAKNITEYIAAITRLVEDANYRTHIGENIRQHVLAVHSGDNWKQSLHDIYSQAIHTATAIPTREKIDHKIISELDILSLFVDRRRVALDNITEDHLRLLPIGLRVNVWKDMCKRQHRFSPSLLLPEWLAMRLIRTRASMQQKGI
jgi:glycosyltransferase involved in cell wall biosynthesis